MVVVVFHSELFNCVSISHLSLSLSHSLWADAVHSTALSFRAIPKPSTITGRVREYCFVIHIFLQLLWVFFCFHLSLSLTVSLYCCLFLSTACLYHCCILTFLTDCGLFVYFFGAFSFCARQYVCVFSLIRAPGITHTRHNFCLIPLLLSFPLFFLVYFVFLIPFTSEMFSLFADRIRFVLSTSYEYMRVYYYMKSSFLPCTPHS